MKIKRMHQITEYLIKNQTATIEELCLTFDVSKNTIRKDLTKLAQQGKITKIYGGAAYLPPKKEIATKHPLAKEKAVIAEKAAELIEDNDIIFIDSGTTTQYMPKFIQVDKKITILTNSLDVLNNLLIHKNCRIFLVGNSYNKKSRSFSHVENWQFFNKININKAFMSTAGISANQQVTTSMIHEFEIKQKMLLKADEKILLADSSKFDKTGMMTYGKISDFKEIISD